ncbi:MAG: hypothetical protein ABI644_12830 [Arenimonas sp.]
MNTPMTKYEIERELQRQEKAEQRERILSSEHDDAVIDQYRLIHRVLKESDIPALPSNFAYRVAQQVQDFEEHAQFENISIRVTMIILVVAGLFFAVPALIGALQKISAAVTLPWPMLWAAILALAFAGMLDRATSRYRIMHR